MFYQKVKRTGQTHQVCGLNYVDCEIESQLGVVYTATLLEAEAELCRLLDRLPLTDIQRQQVVAAANDYAVNLVIESKIDD